MLPGTQVCFSHFFVKPGALGRSSWVSRGPKECLRWLLRWLVQHHQDLWKTAHPFPYSPRSGLKDTIHRKPMPNVFVLFLNTCPDTPVMAHLPTLTPFQQPQLIGKYGSPMECLGWVSDVPIKPRQETNSTSLVLHTVRSTPSQVVRKRALSPRWTAAAP